MENMAVVLWKERPVAKMANIVVRMEPNVLSRRALVSMIMVSAFIRFEIKEPKF